jgi:predicted aldo/keto reductase-like oxidoreductase
MTPAIVAAINTGKFDYVNLHYHYIGSYTASGSGPEKNANAAALQAAKRHDMGVFIISPYDKGGMRKRSSPSVPPPLHASFVDQIPPSPFAALRTVHVAGILYHPPRKFADLVAPLHPIQFQTLWGLRQADVHTLSLGAARPQDFDLAYAAAIRLGEVEHSNPRLLSAPLARLEEAAISALGKDWWQAWSQGLPDSFGHIDDLNPDGTDTDVTANPFGINFTMAAWLYTISEAWGFVAYAKQRYAQYVSNDKAWDAKIADGETASEIIDSWTWTPGRSIGATVPSDKPALLHTLRHSAVGAEKMLDVLYRTHEVSESWSDCTLRRRFCD